MLSILFKQIKNLIFLQIQDKYKQEFATSINHINVTRAIISAIAFIGLEILMLVTSFFVKRDAFLKKPDLYYAVMYLLMIAVMGIFILIFLRLEKNIEENGAQITAAGIAFGTFILMWCAAISILDQLSYGQIIVYMAAVLAVAVAPLYRPLTLLTMYLFVHILFLLTIPHFLKQIGHMYGNVVNSTTIMIIAWIISCMRYKNRVEDFTNRKNLQEKSEELQRVNHELEEANRMLEILSHTDSLTGIYNRSMYDIIIDKEWNTCKREKKALSLIMIDIDFFKSYNDNYGHQAGDECIRRVAEILSGCIKDSSDTVARYGGEEFAVILPKSGKQKAYDTAESLRKNVEEANILHESSAVAPHVTISLGVCTVVPSEEISLPEFIKTADQALYKAKKKNRNVVITGEQI